jgi:hypothetical protein
MMMPIRAYAIILPLASLILAAGCKKIREIVTGKSHRAEAEGATHADWLGFTPYPAARQLCDEFTMASSGDSKPIEIHSITFATRNTTQEVIAFYSKAERGTATIEENSSSLRQGSSAEAVLYVDTVSPAPSHTCANQPHTGEETIIDVSSVLRP